MTSHRDTADCGADVSRNYSNTAVVSQRGRGLCPLNYLEPYNTVKSFAVFGVVTFQHMPIMGCV